MAHITSRQSYTNLVDRLNRFPQGAPSSETLYKILEMLFSVNEAEFVSLLPIKPFDSKTASKLVNKPLKETEKYLQDLASRGILLDAEINNEIIYTLPPPMAGFFEFSMMRLRSDIDQKILAELFYQYLNVEEDFIKSLFTRGETQLGRTFINEESILSTKLEVLDYERASEVIKTASHIGIGMCYCRHKMEHASRACNAPMNICMTFNNVASSLIKHKIARQVDVSEGLDLLQTAYDHNLVQFGENVQKKVGFICNCCGCCCEAMIAQKRFASLHPIHTTNYLPNISESICNGCAKCVDVCPVEAMALVSANHPVKLKKKKAKLNDDICLGCGVCAKVCKEKAIEMVYRSIRVITPVNSAHKTVIMAIERGQLQNLIFDQNALWNHRAMAAILGVILKLPPLKQVLASQQMKSKYLGYLLSGYSKN
jgi:Pyruvate/2-oxoacid:ferredoxin oxidoreductase delta subunit